MGAEIPVYLDGILDTRERVRRHPVLTELRQEAEDLLREYGTDRKVGGIGWLAIFLGSHVLGILPKDAAYRKTLEVTLPPGEDNFQTKPTMFYMETVDRGLPSATPRIDIYVGSHKAERELFGFSNEMLVVPSDKFHHHIGVDKTGRGTWRYTTVGGGSREEYYRYSVPLEQATRYLAVLGRAREVLAAPAA